jgi:hypothetical protein
MYQYAYVRLLAEKENRPFKLQSNLIKNTFRLPEESLSRVTDYKYPEEGYPYYSDRKRLDLMYKNRKKLITWFKPSDYGKKLLEEKNFPPVINVRGGDFKSLGWLINSQYYCKSIQHLGAKPIVVTDDPCYSKEIFKNIEILHTPDDFSILYHAKKLVCSNSTYCWWPAFLGEHELIICPDENWVKNSTSLPPFLWGIKNMSWACLKLDGSLGKPQ